ncbi:golgin subfamily A member 6-like protein 1 [Cardiocondyla obscurior]|uniref:golgin subfamily A member 6-like protein 1 n=1 Tax=Cardiocondyla obscurior TaxID=286306 RepID=UPI0039658383
MRNGDQREHVRERVKKAAKVMGQVWALGRSKFRKDWSQRIWLFDRLVWSVANYGLEIWGWGKREEVESLQNKYLRWLLGVKRQVPRYMIREELQREKLRGKAGMRAWKYEIRLNEGRGDELARWCWKEIKEKAREGKTIERWKKKRKEYYKKMGWSIKEVEEKRLKGELRGKVLIKKDKEMQRKERKEKIIESRFNKFYKRIKKEGVPEYLKKGWKEERWMRMARFRLGNEIKGYRYWKNEEGRKCRMCGEKKETWEHVWTECIDWREGRNWEEVVEEIVGEEEKGEEWLKILERTREGMCMNESMNG